MVDFLNFRLQMKSKAMQYINEEESKGNLEKRNDSKGNEKFCYITSIDLIQSPNIYTLNASV